MKQVQNWSRSPFFADVPAEIREMAAATVPWRTEADVYRSALAAALPDGLAMPRALRVADLDELSCAVWLEAIPTVDVLWDRARYVEAARLLGRFAGCPRVRELTAVGVTSVTVEGYVEGRLVGQVLPMLRDEQVWQHPLVAPGFGPLRDGLLSAADRASELGRELSSYPLLAGHGDACANNLLVREDRDGFTLIDFNYFGPSPLGFDLGQLLVGAVQLGEHPPDDLAERGDACLDAYRDGLAAEGYDVSAADLRRAHALQLVLFTGLSCLPFELLGEEPTPEGMRIAAARADLARHSLDLLAATE